LAVRQITANFNAGKTQVYEILKFQLEIWNPCPNFRKWFNDTTENWEWLHK